MEQEVTATVLANVSAAPTTMAPTVPLTVWQEMIVGDITRVTQSLELGYVWMDGLIQATTASLVSIYLMMESVRRLTM